MLPIQIRRWSNTQFFCRFSDQAAALNVSADDLYTALLADAELQPPNWNLQGRQADAWKQFSSPCSSTIKSVAHSDFIFIEIDYIPQDMFDAGGANTKQVSRTLEVSYPSYYRKGA